jgi:REP element-mobilizing transposase RayT
MPRDDLRIGRYSAAGHAYHVTTLVEGREPIFSNLMLGRILDRGMKHLHDDGDVQSLAFVVMPEHLHWLFVLGDRLTLSGVVRSLKGNTSVRLGRAMGRR